MESAKNKFDKKIEDLIRNLDDSEKQLIETEVHSDRDLKAEIKNKDVESVKMLKQQLRRFKKDGYGKVKWLACNDEFVCENCQKLNGQIFTIDEAVEVVNNHQCRPNDQTQNCRCCFRGVIDTAQRDPGKSPSVVSKTIIEGDKMRIVFDLSDDFMKKHGIDKK